MRGYQVVRWALLFNAVSRLIQRRNVAPKSTIQSFDPLCEVQSDKASVEITSPFDGVVKQILVEEGQVAKVGAGLCLIEVEEEEGAAVPNVVTPAETQPVQEKIEREQEPLAAPTRRLHPHDPNYAPSQDEPHKPGVAAEDILAAPSVRHFARKVGVDLAHVAPGSGKDGRVEKADVEAYLLRSNPKLQGKPASTSSDENVVVELGRTRYSMWKAMTKVCRFASLNDGEDVDVRIVELGNTHLWVYDHFGSHLLTPPTSHPQRVNTTKLPPLLQPYHNQTTHRRPIRILPNPSTSRRTRIRTIRQTNLPPHPAQNALKSNDGMAHIPCVLHSERWRRRAQQQQQQQTHPQPPPTHRHLARPFHPYGTVYPYPRPRGRAPNIRACFSDCASCLSRETGSLSADDERDAEAWWDDQREQYWCRREGGGCGAGVGAGWGCGDCCAWAGTVGVGCGGGWGGRCEVLLWRWWWWGAEGRARWEERERGGEAQDEC